jgi:hypothetical protein
MKVKPIPVDRAKELFEYKSGVLYRKIKINSFDAGTPIKKTGNCSYLNVRIDKVMYKVHRIIWAMHYGEPGESSIDHINGITTDNRIENLRLVTVMENQQNQRKPRVDNKLGLLGVSWNKTRKKYVAQIRINGVVKFLGGYEDPMQAHQAYLLAKRKNHSACTI